MSKSHIYVNLKHKQIFFRSIGSIVFHLIRRLKIEILNLPKTLCTCYTMETKREGVHAGDHAGEDVAHYWSQIAKDYRNRSENPPLCSIHPGKVIISHENFCIEITGERQPSGVMNVILKNNNIPLPIRWDRRRSTWILVNNDSSDVATHILAVTFLNKFCRIVKKVHNNV